MFRKVVVTGGAGFIGGHLCNRLAQMGSKEIVAVDSLRSGDWDRVPDAATRVEEDIVNLSTDQWRDILDGADALFHLAAEKYNSSSSTPDKLLAANVVATEHLFRAAALEKVNRVVFTSSLYSYGSMGPRDMREDQVPEPSTLYGASKLMGEGILRSIDRELGLSWNVARLFFIYGPKQFAEGGYKSVIISNFERIIRREPPIINGSGEQSLDYVFIDDCVDALIQLATASTEHCIVNVSSGQSISVSELTNLMLRISNNEIQPLFGPSDWTEGSRRCGNANLIRKEFGWKARTELLTGLREVFRWMNEEVK